MPPFELCVSSDLSQLARISEFVTQSARQAGVPEADVYDIQMATDEACTNSIEHAYSGNTGEVRVCCWVENKEFVVRVTDFGKQFDPNKIPVPDTKAPLESRDIGGLGLFFMRELTDGLEFHSDGEKGNQVILRKRINSSI
jgi:anti-sigma regulatory factor (Ser/Thr protein kinase)